MLGILTLDTAFPRIRGDVGSPDTFAFPVRVATVRGASVDAIVHGRDEAWLEPFTAAIQALADAGCTGVATTCGFLARWQRELAHASRVPVLTSSLLQVPLVRGTLAGASRVGIVTYSARDLDARALEGAGVPLDTPIEGVPGDSYFATTIRRGTDLLDRRRMSDDTVAAARRLVEVHAGIGAIVLECANMPPYRDAVARATGLPVFDAAQLVAWFHAGTTLPPRDAEHAGSA